VHDERDGRGLIFGSGQISKLRMEYNEPKFAEGTQQYAIEQMLVEAERTGDGSALEKMVATFTPYGKLLFFVQLDEFRRRPRETEKSRRSTECAVRRNTNGLCSHSIGSPR
jgi:hypothetical protein